MHCSVSAKVGSLCCNLEEHYSADLIVSKTNVCAYSRFQTPTCLTELISLQKVYFPFSSSSFCSLPPLFFYNRRFSRYSVSKVRTKSYHGSNCRMLYITFLLDQTSTMHLDQSVIFRVVNIIVGCFMIIGGVVTILTGGNVTTLSRKAHCNWFVC